MQVNVTGNFALSSVGPGLVAALAMFSLTDSAGTPHSQSVGPSSWPTARNPDGSMDISVSFPSLPVGEFTGTVQMADADGNPVGSARSFSSPSDNQQFTANGVTVSVS